MKRETLQSLLIDRSLGELDPETDELLEAYLAHDGAAAEEARRMICAVDVARRAVARPEPEFLPQARWLEDDPKSVSFEGRRRFFEQLLPLAACVVLGVGLGWVLRNTERSDPRLTQVDVAQHSAVVPETGGENRFWTMANPRLLRQNHAVAPTRQERKGIWNRGNLEN